MAAHHHHHHHHLPGLNQREGRSSKSSNSTSESEKSFVSANLEHEQSASKDRSHTVQSEPLSERARASSSPRRETHKPSISTSPTRSISSYRPTPATKGLNGTVTAATVATVPSPQTFTPISSQPESYFSLQPATSGFEPRSPFNRRPPASRSSHGIETSSGPPPALSTQRSYNADLAWRSPPFLDSPEQLSPRIGRTDTNGTIDSVIKGAHAGTKERRDSEPLQSSITADAGKSNSGHKDPVDMARIGDSPLVEEDEEENTIRFGGKSAGRDLQDGAAYHGHNATSSRQDLFLDLVRSDLVPKEGNEAVSRSERRRVGHPSKSSSFTRLMAISKSC